MEKVNPFDGWTAQLFDNTKWYERVILWFIPMKSHIASDGYVLYKSFRKKLYVYAHGHFIYAKPDDIGYDGGSSQHWTN